MRSFPAVEQPGRTTRGDWIFGAASQFRVVFTGPVGVGKTTAVRALSDVETMETEMPLTLVDTDQNRWGTDKTTTTVGIEYGVWRATEDVSVALVGTPGQRRFNVARAAITAPSTRVLLWLYGDDIDHQAESWLPSISRAAMHRFAVVVTRTADDGASARSQLAPILARHGVPSAPVLTGDARQRDSVASVVSTVLEYPEESA